MHQFISLVHGLEINFFIFNAYKTCIGELNALKVKSLNYNECTSFISVVNA